jgi:hypothetical protein
VFGWGMMNNHTIEYNNNLYKTVQVLFSKSSGDDITKIEMEFDGITIPNLLSPIVDVFGGITEVDDSNNFSMIISDNILTLDFIEEFENQTELTGTRTNELLINLPFINREDKFGFKSIKVYKQGDDGHVEILSSEFYINSKYGQPYPYVSKYYGGIGNIVINEESPQTWIGYCDNNISLTEAICISDGGNWIYPYYPVLPKINKIGKFDEERLGLMGEEEWIPFGSPDIS